MGPMKFAKLNGLSVSSLSMPPAKGDPDERVSAEKGVEKSLFDKKIFIPLSSCGTRLNTY